jgi:kynurenine formamidase
LLACAAKQGVEIQKRDILVIRTGITGRYYRVPREEFWNGFLEPGLIYSPELVRWFQEMEIPNLVTDTIGNEATIQPGRVHALLHGALMRNLGIAFTELAWLDDLAADCATDHQYDFLYSAGPLKVVAAAGAPVNPVVIK